jgi:uncharacterized protein (DUF58 family)
METKSDQQAPLSPLTSAALGRLGSLYLRARVVEGRFASQHRSRFRGASVDFADHREYAPGDDTRHLHWRLYARSERYFVKEFDADTNLCGYLLLDISRSMAYPPQGLSKLTYATHLAAGLAYVAWRHRGAPGLYLLGSLLRQALPLRTQRGHLQPLMEVLAQVWPGGGTDLPRALSQCAQRFSRRGLGVVISHLWLEPQPLIRGLRFFRHQGHEVMVLHVLHPDELRFPFRGAWVFVEPESERRMAKAGAMRIAYERVLRAHLGALRYGRRRHDIACHLCPLDQPFEVALGLVTGRRPRAR